MHNIAKCTSVKLTKLNNFLTRSYIQYNWKVAEVAEKSEHRLKYLITRLQGLEMDLGKLKIRLAT